MTKALKSGGFHKDEYIHASDGVEGLELIRRERPKLVLCDLHMPNMDGLELLRNLRQARDTTKVVIVSIDNRDDMMERVKQAGGDGYIKKPFSSDELLGTLWQVVGNERFQRSPKSYDLKDINLDRPVFERVLSSLTQSEITLEPDAYTSDNAGDWPFYIGTLIDSEKRMAMSLFLSNLAANSIAALMNNEPLTAAAVRATNHQLDEVALSRLSIFLGVFSAICRPNKPGALFEINGEVTTSEKAIPDVKLFLGNHVDSMAVYSLRCDNQQSGTLIMLCP